MSPPSDAVLPLGTRSIAKRYSGGAGGQYEVMPGVYPLGFAEYLANGDEDDVRGLKGHHVTPFFLRDGPDRGTAESHRQQPVIAGGLASALQVTEDE